MKTTYLLLLSSLCIHNIWAQELKPVRDFGLWGGVVIEKKVCKNFKLGIEQQIRTFHNSSKLDDYFLDVGLKYSIDKRFKLGGGIRYIYDTKRSSGAENNYRYNLDIEFRNKITEKIKIVYRLRYQKEYVNLFLDYHENKIYYSAIRNKLAVEYFLNKAHTVYFSGELFRLMETYRRPYFNKIRLEAGDDLDSKPGKFNFSFGIEKELNAKYPYAFFYLKVIYTIEL